MNKGRDYYYFAPMYRNAVPMPPPGGPLQVAPMGLAPPRMMLVERPKAKGKSSREKSREPLGPPCTCVVGRTRSLEDVRSEVSEWEDLNNNVENGKRTANSSRTGIGSRKSMENLLDVDVIDGDSICFEGSERRRACKKMECCGGEKGSRRRGSFMVRFGDVSGFGSEEFYGGSIGIFFTYN